MIYVAEITARIDSAGTEQVFLFGTEGFTTRPTDTPANTICRARLKQPSNYSRSLDTSAPFGAVQTGYGESTLINTDGSLDDLLRYGYGGGSFRLLAKSELGGDYPADWTVCLVTSMDRAEAKDSGTLAVILRDPMKARLDKPICATFAGTGGLEGTAAMTGQPKPRVYGAPFNAPLTLLNGNDIYMMSDKQYTACYANFDGRYIITSAVAGYDNVANYAALVAQVVAPGTAYRCGVDSVVKLGSVPAFPATFDGSRNVAGYASPYRTQVGQVVYDMATDAGLVSGDIDAGVSGVTGTTSYFVRDSGVTYATALDAVAKAQACWVGFNRLGILQLAAWAAPSGSPEYSFNAHNCRIDSFAQIAPKGVVKSNGARNWQTLSTNEVANTTKTANLEFANALANQSMSVATAGSAPAKFPLAEAYEFDYLGYNGNVVGNVIPSSILNSANALSYQSLIGVERDVVQVTTPLSLSMLTTIDLGDVVQVKVPRFGLDAGKLYRVAGVRYEVAMNKITFTLWG